ncbi:MAG: hypothetical protein DI537_10445 [Stutzerimonas stutzeri]|nr:MAG: hypothetical protein DI537_10445 [Stutzerimonas stutzeri]
MSYHRRYNERLDPAEIQDTDLRKGVFRAMSKDFLECNRSKVLTDGPGTLARMMEHAYKAGMEVARADSSATPADRLVRQMSLHDLPSLTQRVIEDLKDVLFGWGANAREPDAKHLWAFMTLRDPRFPTLSKDRWRIADRKEFPFSDKAFGPLVKAGLYEIREISSATFRVAMLTEWGFEFLATGKTSFAEDRAACRSSTYHRYQSLTENARTGFREAVNQVFGPPTG